MPPDHSTRDDGSASSPKAQQAQTSPATPKRRKRQSAGQTAVKLAKKASAKAAPASLSATEKYSLPKGPIALVGLMGVGKTTVGRRLSKELGRAFFDSDEEIERASGRTVAGYFRDHGEADFRDGERRVIDRLLDGKPIVLATGGGAFIQPQTREMLQARALTIFLRGDFETVFTRVRKKDTRPLLKVDDPRATFQKLYDERYPIYAEAHIIVDIAKGPHARTVTKVLKAVDAYIKAQEPHARDASS